MISPPLPPNHHLTPGAKHEALYHEGMVRETRGQEGDLEISAGRREVSPAYGGCMCSCHRVPGIIHVVACCHPGPDDKDALALLAKLSRKGN
jgi:hypothetical protein